MKHGLPAGHRVQREEIKEDLARGIAVGQRWDGTDSTSRVITGIVLVRDRTTPWVLVTHLNQEGKNIEGSGVEWANWRERSKAVLTRSKPQ